MGSLHGAGRRIRGARRRGPGRARHPPAFVLARGGTPLLIEAQRDQLWLLFRRPAYLLLLDERGRIMGQ